MKIYTEQEKAAINKLMPTLIHVFRNSKIKDLSDEEIERAWEGRCGYACIAHSKEFRDNGLLTIEMVYPTE